ncbi:MAG: hypothetical protein ABFS22_06490 [Pseudomonadota bacterium]
MKHKRVTYLLIFTLLAPAPVLADEFEDMFGFMFRMMLTAMNVMSDMADNDDGWGGNSGSSPWSSMSPGMGMWPGSSMMSSGMGMWPGSSMMSSGMGMWPGSSMMSPGMGMWPGSSMMSPGMGMGGWPGSGSGMNPWGSMPWGGSNFGNMPWGGGNPWKSGRAGAPYPANVAPMVSLLDGKWYGNTGEILEVRGNRFRLKSGRNSISGMLTIQDNIVRMYTPKTGSTMTYTFMRNQTGLVLQEPSGNLLVFQQYPIAGISNMSYVF